MPVVHTLFSHDYFSDESDLDQQQLPRQGLAVQQSDLRTVRAVPRFQPCGRDTQTSWYSPENRGCLVAVMLTTLL